jgi:hypothetical protein
MGYLGCLANKKYIKGASGIRVGYPPLGKLCQKIEEKKMEEFEMFWKNYPRKVAKAEARKAWKQTEKVRPSIEAVINAIKQACQTEQWMRAGGQFIPHAATWLRGERWEDEFEVKLPDVINEKPWHESATGIEAKGRELGLTPDQFPSWPQFKQAVMHKVMRAA